MEKVMVNIHKYGNTTLQYQHVFQNTGRTEKVKKGDYLSLSSFGAGYTWGSVL